MGKLGFKLVLGLVSLVGLCVLSGPVRGAEAKKPILIINEDNDHFFKQPEEFMTLEALQAYVDQMKDSYVTHFFMCPQGQRTSYDSKVHERIWEGMADGSPVDYGPGLDGKRWTSNCKKLCDAGIDPYSVWIQRCREDGISPWVTMRMNDVHHVSTPNYFRNFNYWRQHPELWRVPNCKTGNWTDCAFNYARQEVRDFYFACAKELMDRYDADGFELDWMRFCLHLTPGKEEQEAHFLTDFVRQVRQYATEMEQKRGHKISISVRVPATPEGSAALGMNAVEWAKEGLVDQIVASCFFSSSDFNISADSWKKAIGKEFPVFTATDDGMSGGRGCPRSSLNPEFYAGWANAMLGNGADGLYLFNLVYRPKVFQQLIAEGFVPERILNVHRRHAVTYRDFMAGGKPGLNPEFQLPQTLDAPRTFEVQFGRCPTVAGKLWVTVGLAEGEQLEEAQFAASLNGTEATACEEMPHPASFGNAKRAVRFRVPQSAVRDGLNSVIFEQKSGKPQKAVWVELEFEPEN